MKIEITLKIDKPTNDPYWDAKLMDGDNIVMQVVSLTFKDKDHKAFLERYENLTVRLMKEIDKLKMRDKNFLKYMLTLDSKLN